LRKKLIGKPIKFRVDYAVKESGKNYGTVFLDGENINQSVLEAGFGELKAPKSESDEYKQLKAAQERAQEKKLNIWSEEKKENRPINTKIDTQQLLKSFKSKPVNVIVEHVLNGASLKVQLASHDVVTLNLTGVACPMVKKDKDTGKEIAQPFAKEAKFHTECRLLNRDVTVLFEGIDNSENLHGTIIISTDESSDKPVTYQEELLLTGYASVAEWSAAKSKYAPRFRQAEQRAKNEKKALWTNYQPPKVSLHTDDATAFKARVLEVISGDSLKIQREDGTEEKITLSNIKTPRYSAPRRQDKKKTEEKTEEQNKNESEPWGYEARDLLRSRVAGKEVLVKVDYRREFQSKDKTGQGEVRKFCTVSVNGKSVAVDLAREGYAKVIKFKADEERSSAFDQLVLAENEAIKRTKGIHGKRRAPTYNFNDVSSSPDAATKLFKLLSGKSTATKAIVERVLGGNSFILVLPNDNSIVKFSISGIQTPSADKQFSKEATQYALQNASLRDAEIILENVNKNGGFVGQLMINGKNIAYGLLESGFAIVAGYAKKLKNVNELEDAEDKAKNGKKGVWSLENPLSVFPQRKKREFEPEQEKLISQKFTVSTTRPTSTIRVTDFEDTTTFFYQGSDVVERLKTIDQLISEVKPESLPTLPSATVGALCLSQYTEDGNWYRAKIVSVSGPNAVVLYSDFGNREEKPVSTLKQVPADSDLLKVKPCAEKARLAFVKPHRYNFKVDLESLLRDALLDGEWLSTIEYTDGGVEYVTLVQKGAKNQSDSINLQIIRSGLVYADKYILERFFKDSSILKTCLSEQQYAINQRLNLWEVGEIYDDEEEEDY